MRNFCDDAPSAVPYRTTMTQPYVYWTLDTPVLTIIGLFSNVEGSLDPRGRSDQQNWLTAELQAAPTNKKLLIAVHHPCYSLDSVHGGCPDILTAIDSAIVASNRRPDAVLAGHVHNYQRFSRLKCERNRRHHARKRREAEARTPAAKIAAAAARPPRREQHPADPVGFERPEAAR